ncbi:TetR/AcrR family transcriptional regulator [Fodinicola feengrottensis]|uniref:TetR/AcrR family transcriptional regulator n=1 Tax=Fodinicola feengrottensis TaxID=435914 RepID=A0ABN2GLI3_9ACTN|nr:TetR/AcrR family transcriptional regulator [Fodinicola feengrottensis]
MSPRGVAIPEVRERLFLAAERVLDRDGPTALTGRAVTRQAGYAAGLLYNHFETFDDFLAEFVLDRAHHRGADLDGLAARTGTRTVRQNVREAALSLLGSNMLALGGLVLSRPALLARLGTMMAGGAFDLRGGERAVANYLEAEKQRGRVSGDIDSEAIALAILGAVHQVILTYGPGATDLRDRAARVVDAVVATLGPDTGNG